MLTDKEKGLFAFIEVWTQKYGCGKGTLEKEEKQKKKEKKKKKNRGKEEC